MIPPIWFALSLIIAISLSQSAQEEDWNREKPATNTPTFLNEGKEIQVTEGQDLELPCAVEDLGEFVILWKFNRTQVLFAGNLRIHRDDRIDRDKKGSLVIKGFQMENAGEYICQISTNPPQDIVYSIKLIAPPIIRSEPSDGQLVVKKGESIRLKCESEQTSFTWMKKNDKTFKERTNSNELVIESAQRADSGIYECIGVNQIGESSVTFRVQVLYKPEVEVEEPLVHASIGHSLNITCRIHADPKAKIFWNKDLTLISDNFRYVLNNNSNTLTINNVIESDFANYSCIAENYLGKSLKSIEVSAKPSKPQFISPPLSESEDSYTLKWIVNSQSDIKSYNLRIREANQESSEWKHIEIEPKNEDSIEKTQTLQILDLEKDKNYEIDLLVENHYGVTRSEIFSFVTSSDPNSCERLKSNLLIISTILLMLFYFQ